MLHSNALRKFGNVAGAFIEIFSHMAKWHQSVRAGLPGCQTLKMTLPLPLTQWKKQTINESIGWPRMSGGSLPRMHRQVWHLFVQQIPCWQVQASLIWLSRCFHASWEERTFISTSVWMALLQTAVAWQLMGLKLHAGHRVIHPWFSAKSTGTSKLGIS